MRGLRLSASMAIAINVLTNEMASAPASSATRAMWALLVPLGEGFTTSGRCESDRIQHPGRSFVEPWRRIARHWFPGQSFHHDAAEPSEMNNVFKLDAVGESAAGGDYGIL